MKEKHHDPLVILFFICIALLLVALVVLWPMLRGEKPLEMEPELDPATISWVSYGDSVTDHGFWQPLVLERYPFHHFDRGVSGSCVAGRAGLPFWSEERIQAVIDLKPDLITVMGGINDYYANHPLGDPGVLDASLEDKDLDTFYGAYAYLIERFQEALPEVRIFLMPNTLIYTHFEAQSENEIGLTIDDYASAARAVAEHYHLPVVDLDRIPYANLDDFMADHDDGIHPNLTGAEKIAALVEAAFDETLRLREN